MEDRLQEIEAQVGVLANQLEELTTIPEGSSSLSLLSASSAVVKTPFETIAEALQELSARVATLEEQSSCPHWGFTYISTDRVHTSINDEVYVVFHTRLHCPNCNKEWTDIKWVRD
jgi:C4-type Zn-finger protein